MAKAMTSKTKAITGRFPIELTEYIEQQPNKTAFLVRAVQELVKQETRNTGQTVIPVKLQKLDYGLWRDVANSEGADLQGWIEKQCSQAVIRHLKEQVDSTKEKLCGLCQTIKPLTKFPFDKNKASGRGSNCNDCKRGYDKKRRPLKK